MISRGRQARGQGPSAFRRLLFMGARTNIAQSLNRTKSADQKSKSPGPPASKTPVPSSAPGPSSPSTANAPAPNRTSLGAEGGVNAPTTPRRSPVSDKTSPAPPLVVISGAGPTVNSEMPADPIPHSPHRIYGSPERSLLPDGQPTPPKAGPLTRLRGGPKDTIPIVGKTPRKQRSSRFYVTEKVDIEKLPNFMGESVYPGSSLIKQRSARKRGTICSYKSCNNAGWCSTSTTPVASSKASKSKPRHSTRC